MIKFFIFLNFFLSGTNFVWMIDHIKAGEAGLSVFSALLTILLCLAGLHLLKEFKD